MSYTTKVIYSTDSNFTNTQNVSKSGKPDSIELKNLTSNQNYYTKAELEDNNGTLLDTSDVLTFQTLAAGTISLSYVSTTRNGNDYIASFTYTSTYALSSAIMLINSVNVQGVIEGNNITFTISGLTQENTYSYTITATDIYTETGTLSGNITTTTHDYSKDYFTIKNESNEDNTITLKVHNWNDNYANNRFYVSEDDGNTWIDKDITINFDLATISPGKKLLIKHSGWLIMGTTISVISCSADYSVSGNVASLIYGDNFTSKPQTNIGLGYSNLFNNDTHLVYAGNLVLTEDNNSTGSDFKFMFSGCKSLTTAPNLSSITSVGDYGMYWMFKDCSALTTAPDLSSITSVDKSGMKYMFCGCTSLTTTPDLSNITSVGTFGMDGMFKQCTSLTTAPDLSNITSVDSYGMYSMFNVCTSLTTAPDLSNITSVNANGMQSMFYGCTSLTTAPDLSNITSVDSYGMDSMFRDCSALTTAPDLSNITSFNANGMSNMFSGCTSLTTAPDLSNITSVGILGMHSMFNGCTSLTTAYAPTITWDTNKTLDWLNTVAASGTLYADTSIASTIPTANTSGCPAGWTVKTVY